MNSARVASELGVVAAQPGLVACALVDASTGLVWQVSGAASGTDPMWEAAVDYWRLHERQRVHFSALGALGAVVSYHAKGVLAVLPCSDNPEVLVVCHGRHAGVDWVAVQRLVRALGRLLRASP